MKRLTLTLALTCALLLSSLPLIGCGKDGPKREEVIALQAATFAVSQTIQINDTLPADLLSFQIVNRQTYEKVRELWTIAGASTNVLSAGLTAALAAENPNYKVLLKALAPAAAEIVRTIRELRNLVNHARVHQILGALQLGLQVIGTYFALQIAKARAYLNDAQIAKHLNLSVPAVRSLATFNVCDVTRCT
jgi:hypothetical protein